MKSTIECTHVGIKYNTANKYNITQSVERKMKC